MHAWVELGFELVVAACNVLPLPVNEDIGPGDIAAHCQSSEYWRWLRFAGWLALNGLQGGHDCLPLACLYRDVARIGRIAVQIHPYFVASRTHLDRYRAVLVRGAD